MVSMAIIFASGMFLSSLLSQLHRLLYPLWCLGNRGDKQYTSNTLPIELFDDFNQRMHQIVIILTERVILSCLDIIFPDLDKADALVGRSKCSKTRRKLINERPPVPRAPENVRLLYKDPSFHHLLQRPQIKLCPKTPQ